MIELVLVALHERERRSLDHAIQQLLDSGRPGAIVLVTSVQAQFPVEDSAIAYVMSKAGLTGMIRSLALRYARDGEKIVPIPGWVTDA